MQAPALELKKGSNLQNTGSSHPTTMGLWWTGELPSQGKESVHRSWPSHLASGTHLCVASSAAETKCSTGWASAAHVCSSIQQIFMQHLLCARCHLGPGGLVDTSTEVSAHAPCSSGERRGQYTGKQIHE